MTAEEVIRFAKVVAFEVLSVVILIVFWTTALMAHIDVLLLW